MNDATTFTPPPSPPAGDANTARIERYAGLDATPLRQDAYELCTLREADIQSIRRWRNDQIDVLRQTAPISPDEQQRYFQDVIRPSFRERRPALMLFSLLRDDLCVGYCGLTHIDWLAGRAEISFLLDSMRVREPRIYEEDMRACLALLSSTAFERLGLTRLFAETFDIRPAHIALLEAAGFVFEGRLREHVYIHGNRVDSLVHGLLSRDWLAARA